MRRPRCRDASRSSRRNRNPSGAHGARVVVHAILPRRPPNPAILCRHQLVRTKSPPSRTSPFGLAFWALGYASRRRLPLLAVTGTLLLRIGLDVLKPWPTMFLVDYVLQGKASSI